MKPDWDMSVVVLIIGVQFNIQVTILLNDV